MLSFSLSHSSFRVKERQPCCTLELAFVVYVLSHGRSRLEPPAARRALAGEPLDISGIEQTNAPLGSDGPQLTEALKAPDVVRCRA
jgi:hypothetical protein